MGETKTEKQKKLAFCRKSFSAGSENLPGDVAGFVKESMSRLRVPAKLGAKAVLLSEETTAQFLRCAPEGSDLRVLVRRRFGETAVVLSMPGEEFDPFESGEEDSEDTFRALLFRSFGENYKYRHRGHVNQVRITVGQSDQTMPTNMRTCTEKLGISPRVSNFSIPLGATINMDGTCIFLVITALFLARAYGIEVPGSAYVSLAVTIMLLSLGAPGVPGAGLICLATVLEHINVPVESIGLIIATSSLVDMFITMSNTTGDVAAALIVAKSENLVDLEVYNRKG